MLSLKQKGGIPNTKIFKDSPKLLIICNETNGVAFETNANVCWLVDQDFTIVLYPL